MFIGGLNLRIQECSRIANRTTTRPEMPMAGSGNSFPIRETAQLISNTVQ